jgi:hypothetical protein
MVQILEKGSRKVVLILLVSIGFGKINWGMHAQKMQMQERDATRGLTHPCISLYNSSQIMCT